MKQGDPLSCSLLNTVIDKCLKSLVDSLGVNLGKNLRISKFAFADSVALLAERRTSPERAAGKARQICFTVCESQQ